MNKIDFDDKFFHSPNWAHCGKNFLDRFRSILKDGYILSAQELGIEPDSPKLSDPERIYLSVHPAGNLSSEYTGTGFHGDYDTGFEMTIGGQYFILNSELKKDYILEPGRYPCECTTMDKIELFKYLVGIGNAGLFISDDLTMCFNLIKYFNGELTVAELVNILKERYFKGYISERTRCLINRLFDINNNRENYYPTNAVSQDANSFIEIGNYYDILKILEEKKRSIPLCDKYGYIVDPLSCLLKVNEMLDYVGSNIDIIDRDGTIDAMKYLIYRLRESERKR